MKLKHKPCNTSSSSLAMVKANFHLLIAVIGFGMVFTVMALYTFQESSSKVSNSDVRDVDYSNSSLYTFQESSSKLCDSDARDVDYGNSSLYTFRASSSKLSADVGAANYGDSSLSSSCNFFSGKWVYDNKSYPLYRGYQCSFMFEGVACEKYGRKNLKYQHWRWQPNDCDLPRASVYVELKHKGERFAHCATDVVFVVCLLPLRFNATEMLEKLRNKRIVYVGDSLNRNQWYSMACLIESSIPERAKDLHFSGSLITYKVRDYNVSIDFYWEPMLLESNCDDPTYHRVSERIIRAEGIENHARHWNDADVLVFNSYIWWRQLKLKILWGSFDSANATYEDVEMLRAYEMALKTWFEWLDNHVNRTKTAVFFVSSSPTHNKAEEWGKPKGQKCFYETEPISEEGYWGMDSDPKMMQLVEATIDRLSSRGFKAQMLNITQLSEYRKDAHPSMHRKFWDSLTEEQLTTPNYHTDCTHWCLPGVPDVWNELLYAYLIHI